MKKIFESDGKASWLHKGNLIVGKEISLDSAFANLTDEESKDKLEEIVKAAGGSPTLSARTAEHMFKD